MRHRWQGLVVRNEPAGCHASARIRPARDAQARANVGSQRGGLHLGLTSDTNRKGCPLPRRTTCATRFASTHTHRSTAFGTATLHRPAPSTGPDQTPIWQQSKCKKAGPLPRASPLCCEPVITPRSEEDSLVPRVCAGSALHAQILWPIRAEVLRKLVYTLLIGLPMISAQIASRAILMFANEPRI